MADADYFAWRALSASSPIKALAGGCTPLYAKALYEGRIERTETEALRFGRFVHKAILEPDVFAGEVCVMTPCQATFKSGARKGKTCGATAKAWHDGQWFCGKHAPEGATLPDGAITPEEHDRIEAIRANLHNSEVIRLLRRTDYSEAAWVDEYDDGVFVKGKMDRWSAGDGKFKPLILDLKTCEPGAATRAAMRKAVLDRQYHIQAALYVKHVGLLTQSEPDWWWVFVEKKPPYDINVLPIDRDTLLCGMDEVESALERWTRCVRADNWPGYIVDPNAIERGGLPDWRLEQWKRERIEG